MTVAIAAKDRTLVPIEWDVTLVVGEIAELWADNPADATPMEFKRKVMNDGAAHVAFPAGYVGDCNIEVRGEEDSKDEGVISVGEAEADAE